MTWATWPCSIGVIDFIESSKVPLYLNRRFQQLSLCPSDHLIFFFFFLHLSSQDLTWEREPDSFAAQFLPAPGGDFGRVNPQWGRERSLDLSVTSSVKGRTKEKTKKKSAGCCEFSFYTQLAKVWCYRSYSTTEQGKGGTGGGVLKSDVKYKVCQKIWHP